MEQWRDVVGYEKFYQVSDLGRVRRIARGRGVKPGRILKPRAHTGGYLTVSLSRNSRPQNHFIHRLVATAFFGTPLKGCEVNHRDGIKTDNRAINLEWVSPEENRVHAMYVLDQNRKGENNAGSKLFEGQVRQIRRLYKQKKSNGEPCYTQVELARCFNVTKSTINLIVHYRRWKHIS